MSTVVAQVRALRINPLDPHGPQMLESLPYLSGRDPRSGDPLVWTTESRDAVLDESVLAQLQADPRLEVRVLDARTQASKKMEIALVADAAAKKAEEDAKALRAQATSLLDEAQSAFDALEKEPESPPEAKPTPYTDQLLAALPDNVREAVRQQRLGMADVREQMAKSSAQLAGEYAAPKSGGAIAEAKAQAAGETPKSKPKKG